MAAGNTLIQTIETDLKNFGGWLDSEAVSLGQVAWADFKALFSSLSATAYTDLKALVDEATADENAGYGVEATAADVLTLASQKGMAFIAKIPGAVLVAAIALAKQELANLKPAK